MDTRFHIQGFGALLNTLGEEQIAAAFTLFVTKLEAHASHTEDVAAGTFTVALTLRVQPNGTVGAILEPPKVKLPKDKPAGTMTLYADTSADGETVLSVRDPRQAGLFEEARAS